LQPTGGGETKSRDLTDDGRQSLLAQALLDQRQNLALALGFGIDDPVGMKAGAQQPRSEQVATGQAPEDGAFEAGRNPSGEQGCASSELGGVTRLDHLMKNASGEATSRQVAIECLEAKGQRLGLLCPTFHPGNLEPQSGKPVLLPGMHVSVPILVRVEDVPIMFS